MPVSPINASAQRRIHARRTRLRRWAPGSATAEGPRSSRDSECKYEESAITAGLVNNNRFAVLRPNEPAPGIAKERNSTLRHENPNLIPTVLLSSSEKMNKISLVPTPRASPNLGRPSVQRLAPHTPARSSGLERDQQPLYPTAAVVLAPKHRTQPSPFVLQTDAHSTQSTKQAPASTRMSPNFNIAAPYQSLLAPQPAPSLPSPPIPPDPLPSHSLASLPIHPSLDFKSLTRPKSCGLKSCQFAPPIPTTFDIFQEDDPMCHIVRTANGKIFSIAAEIAAANTQSTMRPVGNVLIPGPAKKFGEVKGKIDRKKSNRRSREHVNPLEEVEDESEEEGEEEEWLGTDEGFWKQQFDNGNVVKTGKQSGKEGSS